MELPGTNYKPPVRADHESGGNKWTLLAISNLVFIHICVPLLTLAHIWILYDRKELFPLCGKQFFSSLPGLASGSLLCCLLSVFVTQLSMTQSCHLYPALYFSILTSVYIVFGGGFISAIQHGTYILDFDGCDRSIVATAFLICSMYVEVAVVLICITYLALKIRDIGQKFNLHLNRTRCLGVGMYSFGFLLNQISAPIFLTTDSFRKQLFASGCSQVDFILEVVAIYLCLLCVQTLRKDLCNLYLVIVVESMTLKWPLSVLDFALLRLTWKDCTFDSVECLYLPLIVLSYFFKFVAIQVLGGYEIACFLRRCNKKEGNEQSTLTTPLLQDEETKDIQYLGTEI